MLKYTLFVILSLIYLAAFAQNSTPPSTQNKLAASSCLGDIFGDAKLCSMIASPNTTATDLRNYVHDHALKCEVHSTDRCFYYAIAVNANRLDLFKVLYEAYALDPNAVRFNSDSIYSWILKYGNPDFLVYLKTVAQLQGKSLDLTPYNNSGWMKKSNTDLMVAAYNPRLEMIQFLISSGSSVSAPNNEDTPLIVAAKHNPNPKVSLELIKAGRLARAERPTQGAVDVDFRYPDGSTILPLATRENPNEAVITALISAGASVSGDDGVRALCGAALNQNINILKTILRTGVNPNSDTTKIKSFCGEGSPLALATVNPNEAVIQELINSGALVNAVDKNGDTALMNAYGAKIGIIKALLNAHADPNIENQAHHTALMTYLYFHNWNGARLLIEASGHITGKSGPWALAIALNQGVPIDIIDDFRKAGVSLAGAPYVLNWCAKSCSIEQFKSVLLMKPNINEKGDAGMTALMSAAERWRDSDEILKLLVKAGADMNAVNANGETALSLSTHTEIGLNYVSFKILLSAGTNPNIVDNSGNTVISRIVHNAFWTTHHGQYSADFAAVFSDLAKAGSDFNVKDGKGKRPLFVALTESSEEDDFYNFPTHTTRLNSIYVIPNLIKNGADVNLTDAQGENALMLALSPDGPYFAYERHEYQAKENPMDTIISSILSHNVHINAADKDGNSALMLMAKATQTPGSIRIASELIQHGANVRAKNSFSQTALDIFNANPKPFAGVANEDKIKFYKLLGG